MLQLLLLSAAAAALGQSASKQEADTPEHAVRSFYGALASDDEGALQRLTAGNFYAFDGGKRFSGRELFATIRNAHASGRILQWNLGRMDVHLHQSVAWAAWENHGAVGTAGNVQPMTWLESATLRRSGGHWRLEFLHSTRAPAPSQ